MYKDTHIAAPQDLNVPQSDLGLTEEDGVPPKRTTTGTRPESSEEQSYDAGEHRQRRIDALRRSGGEY